MNTAFTVDSASALDRQGTSWLPLPAGTKASVWDLFTAPAHRSGRHLRRRPFLPRRFRSLAFTLEGAKLKFAQTQSTDRRSPKKHGPPAAVASAFGVQAAATVELAIGLIISKLRGIDGPDGSQRQVPQQLPEPARLRKLNPGILSR